MALSNEELLQRVKEGLGIKGTFHDPNLLGKMLAAKGYMQGAGVPTNALESELGIACLTIGVNDLWNLMPGETTFSDAFTKILIPQLAVNVEAGDA